MISLNENDLIVVGKIQERKGCTLARARETYRLYATKLADPTRLDRHDVIWENMQRGVKTSEVKENKTMAAKTKKAKAVKPKAKTKAKAAPSPAVELAELSRDVELTPVGDEFKHVFTANLFGRKHAVVFTEYDNDKKTGRAGLNPFQEARIKNAEKFAKENSMPVAFCAAALIGGKPAAGYAVPKDVFYKFATEMSRGRVAMSISSQARLAYRDGGWDGCKFAVAKLAAAA